MGHLSQTGRFLQAVTLTIGCAIVPLCCVQNTTAQDTEHWRDAEMGILENHVQLTSPDKFVKAGEAYFNPNVTWIIFQAIPVPPEGQEPIEDYYMYVAKLTFDDNGKISGTKDPIQLSPDGSANTCGFFHPTRPGEVMFATTIVPPAQDEDDPAYQRDKKDYKWKFPKEMHIVTTKIPGFGLADSPEAGAKPVLKSILEFGSYTAECGYSPDGRYIVYTRVNAPPKMGDLYIYDTESDKSVLVVEGDGYDGGPFFSPDGTRICYRSDRHNDNLLQLFVADVEFGAFGIPTGNVIEYQLTDGHDVNWCPYWHPSGRFQVFSSSAIGHFNYEVFIIEADHGTQPGSPGPRRYGLNPRRVTTAGGFDGLPVFNHDGSLMMWTSQRTDDPAVRGKSQIWVADFVMPIDGAPANNAGGRRHH